MTALTVNHSSRFQAALGEIADGLTVVTTRDAAGQDIGLITHTLTSVSLDPSLLLWSLSRHCPRLTAFLDAEYFGVHVLATNQQPLADRFDLSGAGQFAGLRVERGAGEIPLLVGCTTRLQCRALPRREGADQVVFVGEVVTFEQPEHPPWAPAATSDATATDGLRTVTPEAEDSGNTFSRALLICQLGRAHFQLLLQLRAQLDRLGLNESDWFVLGLLAAHDSCSLMDLDGQVASSGATVSYEQLARLAALGFAELQGAFDPGAVRAKLTQRGRDAVINIAVAAKIAEVEVERKMGPDETRRLKQWLRDIIRESDPGPPARWRNHTD